jgi:thymidylate synthase
MHQWHNIMSKVLCDGVTRPDRTGTGTLAVFGEQLRFDNRDNGNINFFPAVTTKKLGFGQMAAELACFIRGYSSLEEFHSVGCNIWDANGTAPYWTSRPGHVPDNLGRIYGVQWRDWQSVFEIPGHTGTAVRHTDQLAELVKGLWHDPYGRRHIVTAWSPGELGQMCLPPCHILFQCFAYEKEGLSYLDLRVDMRSVDLFLGLPFDIASYAVLQRLIAKEVGRYSGMLTFQLGDAHIYLNHLEQVRTVLSRTPRVPPSLKLAKEATLFNFSPSDIELVNYEHDKAVPAPMNV